MLFLRFAYNMGKTRDNAPCYFSICVLTWGTGESYTYGGGWLCWCRRELCMWWQAPQPDDVLRLIATSPSRTLPSNTHR